VLALDDDVFAGGEVGPVEMERELVDGRHRQRPEHADPVQNLDLLVSMRDRGVDPAQAPPRERRQRRGNQPECDQRTTNSEQIDDKRGDERARGYRRGGQARLGSEDTGQQRLRHEPGGQRVEADVDERVADPDHAHQPEDYRLVR
jgi:hypothetical protein